MTLAERVRDSLAATLTMPVPFADDMRGLVEPGAGPIIPAAVLIALTDRERPGLILTQRPETMRRHPGQVAFPGGRVDPEDSTVIEAALREAEEEIALPRDAVTVIDTLNRYRTVTGYEITPVVGVIAPDLPLVPHDREVAAVFEVPLDILLDTANHAERTVAFEGRTRTYIEMIWNERRIWGATAAMLVNLSARLQW